MLDRWYPKSEYTVGSGRPMANDAGFAFIERQLATAPSGLTVVEVGSRQGGAHDVRPVVEARLPARYIGVDVIAGPGVDLIGSVEHLTATTGAGVADMVVCAEVMEHVRDWRAAIAEMKLALRPGGRLLITTRSPGYPFHVSPFDYWRYTPEDAASLMADMEDLLVEIDTSAPGVFISACKPADFRAADLTAVALTSVLTGRRELGVRQRWVWRKRFSSPRRVFSFLVPHDAKAWILRTRVGSRLR
jgi:SAM-dependent methyltransferase